MNGKSRIREEILSRRKAQPADETTEKSVRICRRLLASDWYSDSRRLLVYSAVKNEVDLRFFIEQAWRGQKEFYFPKVWGETMDFFPADDWEKLRRGAFGVMEPDGAGSPFLAEEKSVALVPGVAFSLSGGRIGYGKGYYDRYLSRQENRKYLTLIGIAFEFQLLDEFETECSDQNMHRIVTENKEVRIR